MEVITIEERIEEKPGCLFCGTKFNHRKSLIRPFFRSTFNPLPYAHDITESSLSRHLKNKCNKNQSRRRKACHQCVTDKTRCSLKRPSCSRCHMRGISCHYTSTRELNPPENEGSELGTDRNISSTPSLNIPHAFQPQPLQSTFDPNLFDSFFSLSDLESWSPVPPLDLALSSPQYMDSQGLKNFDHSHGSMSSEYGQSNPVPFIQPQPTPDSSSIALANHSMELIFRVLRTWPRMLAEEFQLPPIFHSTHFVANKFLPRPLATCVTLVKMWHGQCVGAEEVVRNTILKELDLIVDQVSPDVYFSRVELTVSREESRRT